MVESIDCEWVLLKTLPWANESVCSIRIYLQCTLRKVFIISFLAEVAHGMVKVNQHVVIKKYYVRALPYLHVQHGHVTH